MKKITKLDNFNYLRNMIADINFVEEEGIQQRLLAFLDREIEILNDKSAKSIKYQKDHVAIKDDLTKAILSCLQNSNRPLSIRDINKTITTASLPQIRYRVGRLTSNGTLIRTKRDNINYYVLK